MSTGDPAKVIIVGGGVTGLITAVRCVLSGHRVSVLERGPIPNPGSSSFDQHRALRVLDPRDREDTRRSSSAHRAWLQLQKLLCPAGAGFYRPVGVVTAWPADQVAAIAAMAAAAGVSVRLVEPEDVPHLRFPDGARGVFEFDAGVLLAERVLRAAALWLARRPAARLRPGCAVTSVDAGTGRVELADGTVEQGDLVLVAGGPWSRALVDLPTVLYRQTMLYLRPPDELAGWWEGAPSAGRIGADGRSWLLPSGAGTLLKVSTDAVCREVASVDSVESRDESGWAEQIMAAGILSDLHRYTIAAVKRCHYAVDAATGRGHLVRVGPTVWARAASGGDGFRTAPLVADQIMDALRPAFNDPYVSTGRSTP